MIAYSGREKILSDKINSHFQKITGKSQDFYTLLGTQGIFELKTVLSDINNMLTFKMTILAADWLSKFFDLHETSKLVIKEKINQIKPNSKGFDINISDPVKILAEVKCTSPINNGSKYGVAQHDSIMDDAVKLIEGKDTFTETQDFYKFIFLLDLDDRTDLAIKHLIRPTNGKSSIANKYNAIKKNNLSLLADDVQIDALVKQQVYVKKIKVH